MTKTYCDECGCDNDAQLFKDRFLWLMRACGNFADGSDQTVTLMSDDALRSQFIKLDKKVLGTDGSTFIGIIDEELKKEGII